MRCSAIAIVVGAMLVVSASAQSVEAPQTGTLTGMIVDTAGAALARVIVTVNGNRTTTNVERKFVFPTLPRRALELRARLRGFQTVVWKVTISEKTEPLKIQMKPAKVFPVVLVGGLH